MEGIKIEVIGNIARVIEKPSRITSGTVGLPVEFSFDSQWNGFSKVAVFRAGHNSRTVDKLDTETTVPWEVLKKPNVWLSIGVYGVNEDGTVAIPTIWANVCIIKVGANPSTEPSADPTLPIWKQMQNDVESVNTRMDNIEADAAGFMKKTADSGLDMNNHHIHGVAYINFTDPSNPSGEAFYIYPDGFHDRYPIVFFGGTAGDEEVLLRGIISGVQDQDAVNVGQLNDSVADVVRTSTQTLPTAQQKQARKNIGAMCQDDGFRLLNIHGASQDEDVCIGVSGMADQYAPVLDFGCSREGTNPVLRGIHDGINDDDAATKGQLNAAVEDCMKKTADIDLDMNSRDIYNVSRIIIGDHRGAPRIYEGALTTLDNTPVMQIDSDDHYAIVIRGVANGKYDNDAVNLAQLNAAVADCVKPDENGKVGLLNAAILELTVTNFRLDPGSSNPDFCDMRLENVGTPVNDADAANKAYVDDTTAINTIIASASGNCVAVADASSQPLRKLLLTGCVGGNSLKVQVCGKNLFDREKVHATFLAENTDIKPTVGGYYIDLFSGTQGEYTQIPVEYIAKLPYLPTGTYTISYQTTSNSLNIFAVSPSGQVGEKLTSSTLGNTFTLSAGTYITLRKAGNDRAVVYSDVQIEAGGQATTYEAYMSQVVIADVDYDATTKDVLAAYPELHCYKPNTTVITDEDAVIEVEYVADPKAYIDNKFAQLAAVLATS